MRSAHPKSIPGLGAALGTLTGVILLCFSRFVGYLDGFLAEMIGPLVFLVACGDIVDCCCRLVVVLLPLTACARWGDGHSQVFQYRSTLMMLPTSPLMYFATPTLTQLAAR